MKYLNNVRGVIHVGANVGQEAEQYGNLPVVWIEPSPETFKTLVYNTARYPSQKCYNYLVSDVDDQEVDFHVSSNNGISSSMFEFSGHAEVLAWKTIHMTSVLRLKTVTLKTLLEREGIDVSQYNYLAVDTQGADLKVLEGSDLKYIEYINVEVSDFEAYKGGCTLGHVEHFMAYSGFMEDNRFKFAWHPSGGSYWDILYRKVVTK